MKSVRYKITLRKHENRLNIVYNFYDDILKQFY